MSLLQKRPAILRSLLIAAIPSTKENRLLSFPKSLERERCVSGGLNHQKVKEESVDFSDTSFPFQGTQVKRRLWISLTHLQDPFLPYMNEKVKEESVDFWWFSLVQQNSGILMRLACLSSCTAPSQRAPSLIPRIHASPHTLGYDNGGGGGNFSKVTSVLLRSSLSRSCLSPREGAV